MRQTLLVVLALVSSVSCGDGGSASPSIPTPVGSTPIPPSGTLTLAGTVTETAPTASTRIAGATITVVEGPNAGRSATSDANGTFQLATLQSGTFTIRVRAADYVERSQSVTLTADQTVTIELDPVFEIVTTTTNASLSGGDACGGYWDDDIGPDSCRVHHVVNMHHDGTLTAELTWTDPTAVPSMRVYRSSNGQPFGQGFGDGQKFSLNLFAHQQYVVEVRRFNEGGGSPPAGISAFSLTVTHPN